MNRAKSICRKPGCNKLIDRPGFCCEHLTEKNKSFSYLSSANTDFYTDLKWINKSISYRKENPLCQECKEIGITKAVKIVHHNPELGFLLANGLDPYDDKYLVGLCRDCHNRHLRRKK